MAGDRQGWLADLSRQFKRHRQGRPGWHLRVKRDRLGLLSDELPPRSDEVQAGQAGQIQSAGQIQRELGLSRRSSKTLNRRSLILKTLLLPIQRRFQEPYC